ncbi:MAG: AraC family transcriptional regulator [Anaerococcus sp.]|nr:AraC family transcriptional regulator [Anaerococcus sp.]
MKDFVRIADGFEGSCKDLIDVCKVDLGDYDISEFLRNLNSFLYAYTYLKYNSDLDFVFEDNNRKIAKNPSKDLIFPIAFSYKVRVCTACGDKKSDVIEKSLEIIGREDRISLEELAQRVHLSKNYLSFLFKKEVGLSFSKYQNAQRIRKARKMILDDYDLDQVAYACGFSSQAHFSSNFKKFTGFTPGDFRKRNSAIS